MKHLAAFILLFSAVLTINAQTTTESVAPLSIGEIRTFRSEVLNENRTLNIYLPKNFDREKSYPVVYLLDGSLDEDFLHITGLVQFFNLMFNMPDTIVVGIANVDRRRDFTFQTNIKDLKEKYPTTGNSDKFIRFLETELQPFVESAYKTNDTKYLIGQSLGGLLAAEILLKKSELFSHYLIVSPSLWWDDESLLKEAKALFAKQRDAKKYVFIAVGQQEDKIMRRGAKAFAGVLQKSGKTQLKTDFMLMPEENHATILHQSINEAFKKLFPYKE